ALFFASAISSRPISSLRSAMRSASSPTESSARSCPSSWVTFFFGSVSSSIEGLRSAFRARRHSTSPLRLSHRSHASIPPRLFGISRGDPMAPLPSRMTAIAIRAPGAPDVLVPEERPVPAPGTGEILVKIAAAGVNRPDVMQRKGLYPPPPGAPDIPGLEIAGEVAALGNGAPRFKVGDAVTALVAGGGYAEYCAVHESNALPVPAGLSMVEAAAIPETFFTVWHNAFERGGLKAGETLLVHGGSSGIGTAAIQLAKAFGARVITTAGSEEKCEACRKLGADVAVNYKT